MNRWSRVLALASITLALAVSPSTTLAQGHRIAPGPVTVGLRSTGDGKPVAGVTVRLAGRSAPSDAQGQATFDGVPEGDYPLVVEHPGFDKVSRAVALARGARKAIPVDLAPTRVRPARGRVTLEGQGCAIAGARLSLTPLAVPAAQKGRHDLSTDWSGGFEILEAAPGMYRLEVAAAGCESSATDLKVGGDEPIEVTLPRVEEAASLTVHVTDAVTGRAIGEGRAILAECWPAGVIGEAPISGGTARFPDLRLARLNRALKDGSLTASRRRVMVRVEAGGHEPAVAPVDLGPAASVRVAMNPIRTVPEEANDSLQAPQTIVTGTTVRLTISKNDDLDFFRFRIPYPGRVRLALASKGVLETVLRLHDSAGKLLVDQGAGSNSDNQREIDLAAGEYVAQVEEWGRNGSSPKSMDLSVTYAPRLDPHETTSGDGRLIQTGEEVRGLIDTLGDRDLYRFEVKRPGWVRVTMPPFSLEHVVRILDANDGRLADVGIPGGAPTEIVRQVSPGWYRVEISEWGDNGLSADPYTFRLEAIEDDGIDDPPVTTGSPRAVRTLEPGALVGSTIDPVGDVDLYAVTLPSAGVVHARLVSPIEAVLRVRLADGRLAADVGTPAKQPAEVQVHLDGPRTVYVEVREWGDNGASCWPYVLSTWFEPCDEADAVERNDTPDAATTTTVGESIRGNILPVGDVDRFRFDVDHPGWLTVKGRSPLEAVIRVRDPKGAALCDVGIPAGQPIDLAMPVVPGEHALEVHEWGDNGWSSLPYHLTLALARADPREILPLASDAARPLVLGVTEPWAIEQVGDRDRFLLDVDRATKLTIRASSPIEYVIRVFDDRTGKCLHDQGLPAGQEAAVGLEAKGPTRYRVELTEWGDNGWSLAPGFVLADVAGRQLVGEALTAEVDPIDPTQVTFRRQAAAGAAMAATAEVDADGDGRPDLDLPAGAARTFRYKNEGVYPARAELVAADGVKGSSRTWVQAMGPAERAGVVAMVHFPAEGQIVEAERPVKVSATSWTGSRVSRVTASVDDRTIGTSYSAPYLFEIPWGDLGPGDHRLEVEAVDARGDGGLAKRTFKVSEFFGLTPADNAVITGNTLAVGWTGPEFGPARVRWRQKGETAWREVVGENARHRRVSLEDLQAGVACEFQPVGAGDGPIRTVTRVKGLAFGKSRYGANIRRDYDQRIGVSVRNNGDKPATVTLSCGKPPEESRLLVGFVGEGSEGAPVDLKPGEERDFMLGLSAQDCIHPTVTFPVRLASAGGIGDEAQVEVQIQLPVVNLEWETVTKDAVALKKVLRLHNKGDTLTDLDVESAGVDVILSPTVKHGLLQAGASMDLTASARLREGFTEASARVVARAVAKETATEVALALERGHQVFGVQLVPGSGPAMKQTTGALELGQARQAVGESLDPSSVDWSRRSNPEDTDGDGRVDRWTVLDADRNVLWIGDDTDGDSQVDFVHADVGDDGQIDSSAFRTAKGWEPTNLVEAWVEMGFSLPWARTAYERHDVDVVMNDQVVAKLENVIPEGNYTFKVPPRLIRFNAAGAPEGNVLGIKSRHLRGGHYVVSSDFNLKLRLTGTRVWTAAKSRTEAEEKARSVEGLALDGPDYSVSSSELRLEGPQPLQAGTRADVVALVRNVGATPTEQVDVVLKGAAPGGQAVELAREIVRRVPLSGTTTVRLPWKAAPGTSQLHVMVDPDGVTGDANPANNEGMLTVSVAGDSTRPTVTALAPADATALTSAVVPLKIQVVDPSGVAHVQASVDSGLFVPLSRGVDPAVFEGRAVLQPGDHRLVFRATNFGGAQAETIVSAKVTAEAPAVKIVEPAPGATLAARQVQLKARTEKEAALAAARVNGGPWTRCDLAGNDLSALLGLSFGRSTLEVLVVDRGGLRGVSTVEVSCTLQPEAGQKPPAATAVPDGRVAIAGAGTIDAFGPANLVLGQDAGAQRPAVGPATRPGAIEAGSSAVYRSATDAAWLVVTFAADRAGLRFVDAAGKEALSLEGFFRPVGEAGESYGGSAAVPGDGQRLVAYVFKGDGTLATLQWPEGIQDQGAIWYRVKEVGSDVPDVAIGPDGGEDR